VSTAASVPAAALALVDAFIVCVLSYLEHARSIRPSTVLSLYLFLSPLLDVPQSRTLFLRHDGAIGAVFTAVMATKLVLLVAESLPRARLLMPPFRNYPPEATSGVFIRTFLVWVTPSS